MTILDEAMTIVRGVARTAQCDEIPEVRIVFATPADQARFKLQLIASYRPSDVVAAPIASKGGADHLEIAGLQVELGNKQRGSRAGLAQIIKVAEVALANAHKDRIAATDIMAMRASLHNLLTIVKGS